MAISSMICMFSDNTNKKQLLKSICSISSKRPHVFNMESANDLARSDIVICDLDTKDALLSITSYVTMRGPRSLLGKAIVFMISDFQKIQEYQLLLERQNVAWMSKPTLFFAHSNNWAQVLTVLESALTFLMGDKDIPMTTGVKAVSPVVPSVKPISILLVDDSEVTRQYVQDKLRSIITEPLRFDIAETGASAIAKCKSTRYDILFLDIVLPDLDGYTVCKTLKNTLNMNSLAVMLTSKGGVFDKLKGVMSGCDIYLVKPLDEKQIRSVIQKYDERKVTPPH